MSRSLRRTARLSVLLGTAVACALAGAGLTSPAQASRTVTESYPVPADGVFRLSGHGYGHGPGPNGAIMPPDAPVEEVVPQEQAPTVVPAPSARRSSPPPPSNPVVEAPTREARISPASSRRTVPTSGAPGSYNPSMPQGSQTTTAANSQSAAPGFIGPRGYDVKE